MFTSTTITFLLTASIASLSFTNASPTPNQHVRAVTELNQAAFKEAHVRDDGATRDFSGVPIKTSDGKCLFVDQLSGDFRANLVPIQVGTCDGSQAQSWDIISKGKHNNAVGKTIVVNTLIQGCIDLNKGRIGKEVSIFACGGRADGSGETSRDELFSVKAGTFPLTTDAAAGTCLTVTGNLVLPAPCVAGSATQTFSLGAKGVAAIPPVAVPTKAAAVSTSAAVQLPAAGTVCAGNTFITVTRDVTVTVLPSSAGAVISTSAAAKPPVTTTTTTTSAAVANPTVVTPPPAAPPAGNPAAGNPTTPVPVSRAGGILNPTLAAEAHTRDNGATRAFTGVSVKAPNGQCLFVDPTAGDFRQNLIPIAVRDCTGAANEKFDIITKGIHNNVPGKALVVSSLMNGCVNFDSRRAAGDRVLIFSCGGRGAGEGLTSDGQTWDFAGGNKITLTQQLRSDPRVCLVPGAGKLGDVQNANADCGGAATYTLG